MLIRVLGPCGILGGVGAVLRFVLAGLAAVAVVALGSVLVLRELGHRQALRDARQFAVLAGQGIVEPEFRQGVLSGDRTALAALDVLVQERVLSDRIMRVKIWSRAGRIVYSDEPRLIGAVYPLGDDEREALRSGGAHAELSDVDRPENRFERGQGDLYEVYARIRAPDGTPLLFEAYQRSGSLVASGRDIWLPFAVPVLSGLVLLWLVQAPLAWRLASRLRRSQLEREALLVKAVEASADERRRIAADLHDGVVQDLAGVSYELSAAAERAPRAAPGDLAGALRSSAGRTREAIRRLRTLLVEIHPPNLRTAGLEAALADLLAPVRGRGLQTSLEVDDGVRLGPDAELVLFRAAGEALRNVVAHADATSVAVRVEVADGRARLEVVDDGRGFEPDERGRRRAEGHVGLSLLEELASGLGGGLEVRSATGTGTRFVVEVPAE
jgi:two-component system, NarL family, sensor kinase